MMMTPGAYEDFVASVCRELTSTDGVDLRRGAEFTGRVTGRRIVVDVAFEVGVLGSHVLVIVECKHYASRVPVDDVEEFHSKLDDIGAHKGIMVTTQGFQEGAVKCAMGRGIALALLRTEPEDGELHYMVRSFADPVTAHCDPSAVLQGNLKAFGYLGQEETRGFRFNSGPEMIRLLQVSMFDKMRKPVQSARRD